MKEQGKNLKDQTNEEERDNLPKKEFRVKIDDDDPKSWKYKGGIDQENTKKHLRRT